MKIVELVAENIKRLVAVDIKPDGNVVQITGKNGQGKTSVLDSIWWALGGGSTIQAEPIRQGENFAKIVLDLGDIKVTRTFKKADGETSSSLFVEGKDGSKFSSPQTVLDAVLGRLTFDPLEFSRMKPRDQFDTLRALVPGFDFAAEEAANRTDFERRTDLNRRSKECRVFAEKIATPANLRTALVDEQEILNEYEKADDHNRTTIARKANRETAQARIKVCRDTIAALQEEAADLEVKLEDAGPLPPLIDVTEVSRRLAIARKENDDFRAAENKKKHEDAALDLEQKAAALSELMKSREERKRAAITAAKLPVEGLTFEEGKVCLRGVPFEQASDAEKLRASIAIAMALNPKLQVVRIRDGSLLDRASMELVATMANERDCQVWIEKVEDSGTVGFVIEEGRLVSRKPAAA